MRVRLVIVAAVALMASACAPGDIEIFLDEYGGNGDLLADDDPGVRAAAESAVEIPNVRRAEEAIDRLFDEGAYVFELAGDDEIAVARAARPTDPRYDFYEAVQADMGRSMATDPEINAQLADRSSDALFRATDKIATERFTLTQSEVARISHERYMDTMRDVIGRIEHPGETRTVYERDVLRSLRGRYCAWIQVLYPEYHSEEFPSEVAFYLATSADRSVCEG